MKTTTVSTVIGGVLLLMSMPGLAHHSMTMFEAEKEITLEGVVREFQYTNPHSWLLVDVTNEDGTVTTWGFEAEGPGRIRLAGIRMSDFPPGTKLTIIAEIIRVKNPPCSTS